MNTFAKLIKGAIIASFMMLGFFTVQGQDEEETSPFSFSGSVDTYFKATPGYGASAPGTSFTNGSGFSMGMVNLVGAYEGEKIGVVADVVFGPRGMEAAFGDNWTGQQIVNQMYGYWMVSDNVTLTLGQWNTYLGYEVISPTANVNYSTSYMFSWGPFSQAGLKADFALSDNWSLTLAFMNPTDVLETNYPTDGVDDFNYTGGLQLGYSTDAGGVYLNSRYGDASGKLFQVDLTGGFDLSDAFYLGFNATILDDDGDGFMGAALYPKVTLSESFALALRGEYFAMTGGYLIYDDAGNAPIGYDADGDGNVIDLTLSGNYTVGNMTLIPEVRFDFTSEDTFTDTDGEASSTLPTLILAAVYAF